MCVQRFDDSLNSAIHITYRISLRSSSMPEPRDPLLKVLTYLLKTLRRYTIKQSLVYPGGRLDRRPRYGQPRAASAEATVMVGSQMGLGVV